MPDKKRCFVVMGFGEKVDFEQQKTFDLDKSYRIIIKKAVESAGLECIRADDVVHAGVIDKPMYELLLDADLVVADLSTANPNAIYELGVRHALRPNTTIVIAERGFRFPFDIKSLLIRQYQHLGPGIDAEEAEKFRDALTDAIRELVPGDQPDSPVYTFIPDLGRPVRGGGPARAAAAPAEPVVDDRSVSTLMESYRAARARSGWTEAKITLSLLRLKMPNDPFVIQQLALATYKEKTDDPVAALGEAKRILGELRPEVSNDPETLGLWGAIHKRLWESRNDTAALEESVRSYGRGFILKDDHYNGINYAFMLDARAALSDGDDAIADRVWAERVRRRVIELCEARPGMEVEDDEGNVDPEATFWLRATHAEALFGIGRSDAAEEAIDRAAEDAPEEWMEKTLREQLAKLEKIRAANPRA